MFFPIFAVLGRHFQQGFRLHWKLQWLIDCRWCIFKSFQLLDPEPKWDEESPSDRTFPFNAIPQLFGSLSWPSVNVLMTSKLYIISFTLWLIQNLYISKSVYIVSGCFYTGSHPLHNRIFDIFVFTYISVCRLKPNVSPVSSQRSEKKENKETRTSSSSLRQISKSVCPFEDVTFLQQH